MAAKPLRNSSGNVYNSHWETFILWANNKGFLPSDLSYVTLAEYLVYLFWQHKKMNTIQVHQASISSVLKILNPPTALPEETLHHVIRRMTILRPREQDVLPKWLLSVVLKGLLKPPLPLTAQTKRSLWRYFHIKLPFDCVGYWGSRIRTCRLIQSLSQLGIYHFGFGGLTGIHPYGPQVHP